MLVLGGGINWEAGIEIYRLLHTKSPSNKDLLYSTGKSTQYPVIAYLRKRSEIEYMCVCVCVCVCIHTLCIHTYTLIHFAVQ